jgi:hypothetical protein
MAGKNSGSDKPWAASNNPWAEMSGLNLQSKVAKAPDPESARAATIREEVAKSDENSRASTGVAAAAAASALTADDAAEYSVDELQEMSLKELQEIARENGIDPRNLSKDDLIDALAADDVALTEENAEDEAEILLEDEESLEADELDGEMTLEEALALLGEDAETEGDFAEGEFEEVETEVLEGDSSFELDDNNPRN